MKRGYNYPERTSMEKFGEAISMLLILLTICVMGSALSGFLFGVFIRVFYYVLNWRW